MAELPTHHGQGVTARMLRQAEAVARQRGAVKMTLEVLSGNAPALALYRRLGYAGYRLDPAIGTAEFMQKWIAPAQ